MTAPSLTLGVTAARETADDLLATLRCMLPAVAHHGGSAEVRLLVNGNAELAAAMARLLAAGALERPIPAGCQLHVDWLPLGDKANALNVFLHQAGPIAETTVLMDGYVQLHPHALRALRSVLRAHPGALGATGVPRSGWSARRLAAAMRREGGLHGNLFALSARAVQQLRAIQFRLPVGLYRVDAVLGAALAFGLELDRRHWDPKRHIVLAESAQWEAPRLRPWSLRDLRTYWRRRERQEVGVLENAAVRHALETLGRPLAELPATAPELVAWWAASARDEAEPLLERAELARAQQTLRSRESALQGQGVWERRLTLSATSDQAGHLAAQGGLEQGP